MSGEDPTSPSLQDRTQAFLQDFFARGEELVRELIEENERLRIQLRQATTGGAAAGSDDTQQLVSRLVAQVERLEAECAEIRKLAGSAARESGGYRSRLDRLEQEHYHLAAMYVAANQFHSSSTVDDVLRTITEILLNFVGVGRFTVYCVDEERQILFPFQREGGDVDECPDISLPASGPLGEVLQNRGPWKTGQPRGGDDEVIMHLPLCSGTRLVGVARIESFLPQKTEFADDDYGLLELISEHSGIGIETAWIRAHAKDAPMARRGLEQLVVR